MVVKKIAVELVQFERASDATSCRCYGEYDTPAIRVLLRGYVSTCATPLRKAGVGNLRRAANSCYSSRCNDKGGDVRAVTR